MTDNPHTPARVLILNSNAGKSEIKAAFDAALNMQIFDQSWALYLVCSGDKYQLDSFCDTVRSQSKLFFAHGDVSCLEWININPQLNTEAQELASLIGKPELPYRTFRRSIENAYSMLTF